MKLTLVLVIGLISAFIVVAFAAVAVSAVEEYKGDFAAVTLKSAGIMVRKDGKTQTVAVPGGKAGKAPRAVIVLPNGNWFVTRFDGVVEFDGKGKVVFDFAVTTNGRVTWSRRLDTGNTLVAQLGETEVVNGKATKKVIGVPHILEVDSAGKVVKTTEFKYTRPFVTDVYQIAQVIPLDDGSYIVAQPEHQAVVQYGKDGKFVKDIIVFKEKRRMPISLFQCPGGNIVVGFLRGENTGVVEVDKDGKVVWELKPADVKDMKLYNISQVEKLANGNYFVVNNSTHWDDLKIGEWTGYPFAEIGPDRKIIRAFTDSKSLDQVMSVCPGSK